MTDMLLYLYAESPVHAGGADSLGVLDLPIQREVTTGYPVIWGQSLKGALRQAAADAVTGGLDGWDTTAVTAVFGSEIDNDSPGGSTTAGLLSVGDAQLVALPVPTLRRTFAWATSELALTRLARKYRHLGLDVPEVPPVPEDRGLAASASWAASPGSQEVFGPCLVELGTDPRLTDWSRRLSDDLLGGDVIFGQLREKLNGDLLAVGDSIMPTLVTECTEFAVRVQLSAEKTVDNGPFHSEYLPTETVLAATLRFRRAEAHQQHGQRLRDLLDGRLHQIGGDETLGKGLVWARLVPAAPR